MRIGDENVRIGDENVRIGDENVRIEKTGSWLLLSTFLLAGVRGFAFNYILKGDFKHEKNADIRKKFS